MRRKNLKSEFLQKECVLKERKAKQKALTKEDFVEANVLSTIENMCIIEREKAKKSTY